jgi:LacI family transcriptional regulator
MIKRVSLKDIAQSLNLTVNTVSRALNDKDDISEKTKKEVRHMADELGYIPNILASSMRTSSSKMIAVLFDNLLNPYFMLMANHINNRLNDEGYRMMIFTSTTTEAIMTMEVYKQMISHRVDGVISFLRPNKKVANLANKMHLPIFVVGREADDLNIDSIFTDDVNGGYLMGEYFHKKGYKCVGYLGGPKEIVCNTKRAEGIQSSFQAHGLKLNVLHSGWDNDSIFDNIDKLVKDKVDAIFCFNDSIAYSTLLYIQENYPEIKDIEVTGYDNIAKQLQLPIKIVTIGTDVKHMINMCVDQLMKRMNDFDLPLYIETMETEIIGT